MTPKNYAAMMQHPDKSVVRVDVQAQSPYEATKKLQSMYPASRMKTWPATSAWSNQGVIKR